MSSRLYVRNLGKDITREVLEQAFSQWGEVADTKIMSDRETGRPRGFAFVVMATTEAAKKAALGMDGADVGGRSLRVTQARDPKPWSGAAVTCRRGARDCRGR